MSGPARRCRPAERRGNARRPVLVVNQAGATRALHQIGAELGWGVADDRT